MKRRGRSWSTAFGVVMATGIVSIAAQKFGLRAVSIVLLGLAALAFLPMAVSQAKRVRALRGLLRRARAPERGLAALGFVAAAAVLGTRLVLLGGQTARVLAYVLLAVAALAWLAILGSLLPALERSVLRGGDDRARGAWLLGTVSTEGLAILIGHLAVHARGFAIAMWVLGGLLYVQVWWLLALRVRRRGLTAEEFTPDWWVVMGGLAIFSVAGATSIHGHPGSPAGVVAIAAWALASAWIPVLAGAELWRIARLGRPRFTPGRWSMVFPLGMYSVSGTLVGRSFGVHWIARVGHWWFPLALAAWVATALGELRFAFRGPGRNMFRPGGTAHAPP